MLLYYIDIPEKQKGEKIMKQKSRILSIRMKILLSTTIMISILVAIIGRYVMSNSEDTMTAMGVEQAQVAAEIATDAINGDAISE